MRRTTLALVALLMSPAAAPALDLERVLCTCHDQATSSGDVQSCLALLTSRLVANGELTQRQRARLLRDPPLAPPDCPSVGAALELDDLRYGLAVHVDRAFESPGGSVEATLAIWNHSDEPVVITLNQDGGRGCEWNLLVRDAAGLARHVFVALACADPVIDVVIPPGETWTRSATLPMTALASEAGEPDGTPLPPGFYHVEGYLSDVSAPGLDAHVARIPVQVE